MNGHLHKSQLPSISVNLHSINIYIIYSTIGGEQSHRKSRGYIRVRHKLAVSTLFYSSSNLDEGVPLFLVLGKER
jgi:hypothetical protein